MLKLGTTVIIKESGEHRIILCKRREYYAVEKLASSPHQGWPIHHAITDPQAEVLLSITQDSEIMCMWVPKKDVVPLIFLKKSK